MALPRCKRCHRALTDPESIASGLGPSCRRILYGEYGKKKSRAVSDIKSSRSAIRPKQGDPNTITLDDWIARLDGGEITADDESLQKEKEPTTQS